MGLLVFMYISFGEVNYASICHCHMNSKETVPCIRLNGDYCRVLHLYLFSLCSQAKDIVILNV